MDGPTAVIVGHSFVKRYSRWIGKSNMAPPTPLHVCKRLSDLQFIGVSGLMSAALHDDDIVFQSSKFDIVMIDCGTNDISNGKTYLEVANNILLFACCCLEHGTKSAIVMSVLPRTKNVRCGEEESTRQMQLFNVHMKALCVPELRISFHAHKGFSRQINVNMYSIIVSVC